MIKELTASQKALIPKIRDEWIKIALDTSPTDKQKAEAAIYLTYEGYQQPKEILWFDNPLIAVKWIIYNRKYLGDFFQSNFVPDVITSKIPENIFNNAINARVNTAVKQFVYKKVFNPVKFVLKDFCDNLSEAINNSFPSDLYEKDNYEQDSEQFEFIEDTIYNCPQGIWQIHELAYYAYFDAIGVDCSKLIAWWTTAKECGCWWCFENIAVVTPKPSEIHLDNEYLLHAEGKPAINYKGFQIYAYHGVMIPEKYGKIHPYQWKYEWLLSEKNAEFRIILIEGIGYHRIWQ
ncbi:MAG: DUF6745 domain-containing protein [Rivularia sp. (in: cyanobacteria)]